MQPLKQNDVSVICKNLFIYFFLYRHKQHQNIKQGFPTPFTIKVQTVFNILDFINKSSLILFTEMRQLAFQSHGCYTDSCHASGLNLTLVELLFYHKRHGSITSVKLHMYSLQYFFPQLHNCNVTFLFNLFYSVFNLL